jgi:serine/threonine-protein kinase SRPK3
LQATVQLLLIALDYLHKNGAVHTGQFTLSDPTEHDFRCLICLLLTQVDISPNNLLVGATDDTPFSQLEKDEQARPVARKILPDRTIYMSRPVPRTNGQLILSDLGSARFGQESFTGDIMPDVYRAPEVILGMEWACGRLGLWWVFVLRTAW